MDISLQHFIYNRTKLDSILLECQELGAHTNIIEFKSGEIQTFMWTHPGARPMGVGISPQCKGCGRLKTAKPTVNPDGSSVVLKCSVCHLIQTYNIPDGWNRVHGSKDDGRGTWLVHIDKETNGDAIVTA
jgi:hypothetical protein